MTPQIPEMLILMSGFCWQARQQFLSHQTPVLPSIHNETFKFARKYLLTSLKNPEVIGFIAQSQHKIVVSLRGSESIQDNAYDVRFRQIPFPFGPGKTHAGWTYLYAASDNPSVPPLRTQIISTIFQCLYKRPNQTVYLTGHSMGGAIVTMVALDLALNFSIKPVVITFGSPKTGDSVFVSAYNNNIDYSLRVINEWDIVTWLPSVKYQHVKQLFPLSWHCHPFGKNHHKISAYFVAVRNLSPLFGDLLNQAHNGNFSPVTPRTTNPCMIQQQIRAQAFPSFLQIDG